MLCTLGEATMLFLLLEKLPAFLGRLVSESRLLQPMGWALGAVQAEFLTETIVVTLSEARGVHPAC